MVKFTFVVIFFIIQFVIYLFVFRDNYETWNVVLKARNEGRLFQKLKWPRDAELVSYS